MSNSIDNMFNKLSNLLNQNETPEKLNNLLDNLGISKQEALEKLNQIDKQELKNKFDSQEFNDFLQNMSQEDIEKIKNINDPNEIKQLYNDFINSKDN